MKISVYGAGYVGLVSGLCFAELGHDVCCMDIDEAKINALKQGHLPIYEENLQELLRKNHLLFTTDFQLAAHHAIVQMIAVGTPAKTDGSADVQFVEDVANQLGKSMQHYCCVVNKSTVPVGTAKRVQAIVQQRLQERKKEISFDMVSNPEFLREGRAVRDCLLPDRIIVGAETGQALSVMRELYRPLTEKGCLLLEMDIASAELTKYAANAFLATKVSFINEISQIAERVGANIHAIKKGIGSDPRINEKFLNAGCGFGGSCFPKDISALKNIANHHHYEPHILDAVLKINDQQQQLLFQKIDRYFEHRLKDKIIALWGLAFKPNTDDIRSASSCVLMERLWQAGATVKAYDPLAINNTARTYANQFQLILCDSKEAALNNADVLAIMTEWDVFKKPDFEMIKKTLKFPVIFDGRNLYDKTLVQTLGFTYFGVGC